MTTIDELLSNHPVFSSLRKDERLAIQRLALLRQYKSGETFAHQGEPWPSLFLVIKGDVNALKISAEGRRLLVARIRAGEIFWGLAFFDQDLPMPVNLVAKGVCQIARWERENLQPFLFRNPVMIWELCRAMVSRMARASEIVEEQAFQPITGRLARLLLDTFESAGGTPVARYLTLDDMALQIGTTREMVCRVLYQFSDQELIEVTRTELSLINYPELKKMAEPA